MSKIRRTVDTNCGNFLYIFTSLSSRFEIRYIKYNIRSTYISFYDIVLNLNIVSMK